MSHVYFLDLRKKYKSDFFKKFEKLIDTSNGLKIIKRNSVCAVKIHVGEDGNLNFVSPLYVKHVVDLIKKVGARPFLTDTTTLYSGRRYRADLHIELAKDHGFGFAPFIVADGFFGDEYVDINGSKIASLYSRIDTMICISHFKGHLNCGFGGTLKNLGMGCASKGGKLQMHSRAKPYIDTKKCTLCLMCFDYCIYNAIVKGKKILKIDHNLCTGCGGCMSICPEKVIKFSWDAASSDIQKSIAEYAANTIENKKVFYINFLIDIAPNCDCFHTNEPMITDDVGILASFDPVSLDQACYDLVKKPIDKLHPEVDSQAQLFFAQKFGAGEREYEIKEI